MSLSSHLVLCRVDGMSQALSTPYPAGRQVRSKRHYLAEMISWPLLFVQEYGR